MTNEQLIRLIESEYGISPYEISLSSVGAGSEAYFVTCAGGKYVLKFPLISPMNHPAAEPELCGFLRERGIPASEFIENRSGEYITRARDGRVCHMQRFVNGNVYDFNTTDDWLLRSSARMLGRIHEALKPHERLPVGIGADFFRYMTPENAISSYMRTLKIAREDGDEGIADDVVYRINMLERYTRAEFDLGKLTCVNTHGDYTVSQLICAESDIRAVIDWTTACVHPAVWEIMRSYMYAAKSCKEGAVDIDELCGYFKDYTEIAPLNEYDMRMAAPLYLYQIAVCDYYGQYYGSDAVNRGLFLHQAAFSTKLIRWFEKNVGELSEALAGI